MLRLLSLALILTRVVLAASSSIILQDDAPKTLDNVTAYVDSKTGVIAGPSDAQKLIEAAMAHPPFSPYHATLPKVDDKGFYCIIHTVVWSDAAAQRTPANAQQKAQSVKSQHWYLYNGSSKWGLDDFTTNQRIFGAKNVLMLYVYVNMSSTTMFSPRYEVQVTSKEPANVVHLFQLAAAFVPSAQQAAEAKLLPNNYAGWADFDVPYVPSDISVATYIVQGDPDAPTNKLRTVVGDSMVFDDEGYYYWDASVGVPIRKMGQLQFNNVNNTVTAQNPDKRNVFALLDGYPFKKDVKSSGFDWRPYGVAGVAIGSQPLHKILVGIGWGPQFAQFYIGALFVKEQNLMTLTPGAIATPAQQAVDTRLGFHPQFAFGINLPVREVFKAATSPKSKTTSAGGQTP